MFAPPNLSSLLIINGKTAEPGSCIKQGAKSSDKPKQGSLTGVSNLAFREKAPPARLPLAQGIIDPVFYSNAKVREDLRVDAEGL